MIKLKPFRQTAGFCGPASLKIVLDYWGVSVSEQAIAQAAGASKKAGVSKKGLIRAARHFGFRGFCKRKKQSQRLKAPY